MPYTPLGTFQSQLGFPRKTDFKRTVTFYDRVRFVGADSTLEIFGGVFTGDIVSFGWDGAMPLDLSGAEGDVDAQTGYAFDNSEGTAQFMGDIFIGGNINLLKSVWNDGELRFYDGASDLNATIYINGAVLQIDTLGTGVYIDGFLNSGGFSNYADNITLLRTGGYQDTSGYKIGSDWRIETEVTALGNDRWQFDQHLYANSTPYDAMFPLGVEFGKTDDLTIIRLYNDLEISRNPGDPEGGTKHEAWIEIGDYNDVVGVGVVEQIRSGPDGTVSTPSWSWHSDPDTGLFRISSNRMGLVVDGKLVIDMGISGNTRDVRFGDGGTGKAHIANLAQAPSFPTYSFEGDVNTGWLWVSDDKMGWATGGTTRMTLDNNGLTVAGVLDGDGWGAWVDVTFLNGWREFASATYGTAAYRKHADGMVQMRGLVKFGSPDNSVIFNLPTGHRPPKQMLMAVMVDPNVAKRLDVKPSGDVNTVAAGTNSYVSLSNILFDSTGGT